MKERLQKILASRGIASRRAAEEMIAEGRVAVNGQVITEMGFKADPETDHIKVDGKMVGKPEGLVYFVLNKPKGVLTAAHDAEGKPVVTDLLAATVGTRVFPVGRLDMNTEGVLLLTNDGVLAQQLSRPASKCPKIYLAKLSGVPTQAALQRLERGITVDGVRYGSCRIEMISADNNSWVKVTLTEGKNHQVRNIFEAVGHMVVKLRRIAFAFLTAEELAPGEFRRLDAEEVERLRSGDFHLAKDFRFELTYRKLGIPLKWSREHSEEHGRAGDRRSFQNRDQRSWRPREGEGREPGTSPREGRYGAERGTSRLGQRRPAGGGEGEVRTRRGPGEARPERRGQGERPRSWRPREGEPGTSPREGRYGGEERGASRPGERRPAGGGEGEVRTRRGPGEAQSERRGQGERPRSWRPREGEGREPGTHSREGRYGEERGASRPGQRRPAGGGKGGFGRREERATDGENREERAQRPARSKAWPSGDETDNRTRKASAHDRPGRGFARGGSAKGGPAKGGPAKGGPAKGRFGGPKGKGRS